MALAWKEVLAWIGPKPHIEAVGAVALTFCDLEFSLYGLLTALLGEEEDIVPFLYFELNNAQRADFIRHVYARRHNEHVCGYVDAALRLFGICAENRNLVMHAMPTFGAAGRDTLFVVKGIKGRPGDVNEYAFGLEDLRAAARSAVIVREFIHAVVDAVDDLSHGNWPVTWPETPPPPRKLSLFLRPEGPLDE